MEPKERVRNNDLVWQPIFARSSISKTRNRTTIPALLLNQNEQIQTKSERQIGILFRAYPLGMEIK